MEEKRKKREGLGWGRGIDKGKKGKKCESSYLVEGPFETVVPNGDLYVFSLSGEISIP